MNVVAREHWADKDGTRLFLWRKTPASGPARGPILFVHGSSMAGQASFDLQVPGHDYVSAMDFFAGQGFDCWAVDAEGYGRSDKHRDINCGLETGADDVAAAVRTVLAETGRPDLLLYGFSSGSLRAALFAQRHPGRVARLALDAFVWTGDASPTLAERRKMLPELTRSNRRPVDRSFVHKLFAADPAGCIDHAVIDAFADAMLAVDTSVPTGTYLEMCTMLPVADPARLPMPVLVMRGAHDRIAAMEDLLAFFARLPSHDKQLTVMPGIAHTSFQMRNHRLAYETLLGFFGRSEPLYRGGTVSSST